MSEDDNFVEESPPKAAADMHRRGKYGRYSESDLEEAIRRINAGQLSQRQASKLYSIPQPTLSQKLNKKHLKPAGHPTVFSAEEEAEIASFLNDVAACGYRVTYMDLRVVIKSVLDRRGQMERRFSDNLPGSEFVRSFIRRNNLTVQKAPTSRMARTAINPSEIREYFNIAKEALQDLPPEALFCYDETDFLDDPREKLVIVNRRAHQVEEAQELSEASFSVMCCGNAAGTFLPPMIVHKAKHLYETWTRGGPAGSVYECAESGSFDWRTFAIWYFSVFVPFAEKITGRKVLIGDSLASHFSPEVVAHARANDVFFVALPPNSAQLTQPLDVGVYRSLEANWRQEVERWRRSARQVKCSIPKTSIPALLNQLWRRIDEDGSVERNLKSGFRACGLSPFNPNTVLRKLPDASPVILNSSLNLQNRSYRKMRKPRGKRVAATAATRHTDNDAFEDEVSPAIGEVDVDVDVALVEEIEVVDACETLKECKVCSALQSNGSTVVWYECACCFSSVCSSCSSAAVAGTVTCINCQAAATVDAANYVDL